MRSTNDFRPSDPTLIRLAERLAQFEPSPLQIDRDWLMFQAGKAYGLAIRYVHLKDGCDICDNCENALYPAGFVRPRRDRPTVGLGWLWPVATVVATSSSFILLFLLASRPVIERPATGPDGPIPPVVSADAHRARRLVENTGTPSAGLAGPPASAALVADASFGKAAASDAGNASAKALAESGGLGRTLLGVFLWGGGLGLGHERSGVGVAASTEVWTVADWLRQRHQMLQDGADVLDRRAPQQGHSGLRQRASEPAAVPRAWPLRVDQLDAADWPHGVGGWISLFWSAGDSEL